MSDRPYKSFGLADLFQEQEEAEVAVKMCKATLAAIEVELCHRFGKDAIAHLHGGPGTWTQKSNGIQVKGTVAKDVTWDSDALLSLAFAMDKQTALRTFNIKATIPEKTYASVTGKIRASAEAARTENVKPIKFTLEKI